MNTVETKSLVPRLYQAATSSASWRIRIALALKEIAYDTVWLDLRKGEHLDESYRDLLPAQQVPCLEIDGHRLFQSMAIIEYLDETRPTLRLVPQEAALRAGVRAVSELINSAIQPMHNIAVRERLQEQFAAGESATQEWCRFWIERRFASLDVVLRESRSRYACADSITMADVFLYPQVLTSQRFDVDMKRFPAISAVVDSLADLTAFHESHPPAL